MIDLDNENKKLKEDIANLELEKKQLEEEKNNKMENEMN